MTQKRGKIIEERSKKMMVVVVAERASSFLHFDNS
jgi:hypothetical protein